MSDVAIVLSVAFVAAAVVAVVWLSHRATALARMEQREERERGVMPRLEACEAECKAMRTEQKTFMANARAPR